MRLMSAARPLARWDGLPWGALTVLVPRTDDGRVAVGSDHGQPEIMLPRPWEPVPDRGLVRWQLARLRDVCAELPPETRVGVGRAWAYGAAAGDRAALDRTPPPVGLGDVTARAHVSRTSWAEVGGVNTVEDDAVLFLVSSWAPAGSLLLAVGEVADDAAATRFRGLCERAELRVPAELWRRRDLPGPVRRLIERAGT